MSLENQRDIQVLKEGGGGTNRKGPARTEGGGVGKSCQNRGGKQANPPSNRGKDITWKKGGKPGKRKEAYLSYWTTVHITVTKPTDYEGEGVQARLAVMNRVSTTPVQRGMGHTRSPRIGEKKSAGLPQFTPNALTSGGRPTHGGPENWEKVSE